MINHSLKQKLCRLTFGHGTLRLRPHSTPSGASVLVITQCKKTKIGDSVGSNKVTSNSPLVTMNFINIESLDVLLEKLQYLREEMLNAEASNTSK